MHKVLEVYNNYDMCCGFKFIESANIYANALILFYNTICMYLIFISSMIIIWLLWILLNDRFSNLKKIRSNIKHWKKYGRMPDRIYLRIDNISDYRRLELSWMFVPLSFISLVVYPSIGLEYALNPDIEPYVSVRIVANQWYWTVQIYDKDDEKLDVMRNLLLKIMERDKVFNAEKKEMIENIYDAIMKEEYNSFKKEEYEIIKKEEYEKLKIEEKKK